MNLIIWMIVIILSSGLIWFLRANAQKREQLFLAPLHDFAIENGSTLSTYDQKILLLKHCFNHICLC